MVMLLSTHGRTVWTVVWLLFATRERRRRNETWPLSTISVVATVWVGALVVNWLRLNGF